MNRLARATLDQLYTTFAGAYDAVAGAASLGEWQIWGRAALEFIPDRARVLELAHGPGHVHAALSRRSPPPIGIDLSARMGHISRVRVTREVGRVPSLARADALHLPFPDAHFDCVISTFPTAFIFTKHALGEIRRMLTAGGSAVIVPGAELTGGGLLAAAVRFAYRVTGQGATDDGERAAFRAFEAAGFSVEPHERHTRRAVVTVWVLRPT